MTHFLLGCHRVRKSRPKSYIKWQLSVNREVKKQRERERQFILKIDEQQSRVRERVS